MNQEPGNTIGNLDVILIHIHTPLMFFFLSLFLSLPSFLLSQYHTISAPFLVCCISPSPPHFTLKCIPINHVSLLLLCFFSILSPVSPARLVTACESGCEDALWQGKPSFPLLSQLTVQDFSSGQEREEEEIQGCC